MKINEYINFIKQLQASHNELILCGSAALILAGVLPERDIGDIDFVTTNRGIVSRLNLTKDTYADEVANGGYLSYSVTKIRTGFGLYKLNVLIFKPDTAINTEKININGSDILCQRISDILYWKEKYNRTKDLIDIDAISLNMLEKAVFDKK